MSDPFQNSSSGLSSPASDAFAITPDDGTDLTQIPRAIYVGSAGDLAVVMKGGGTVTFTGVPAGALLSIRTARILATGTTADAIVGLI